MRRSSPRPLKTYSTKPKPSSISEKHRIPKAPKPTINQQPKAFQSITTQNIPPPRTDFSDAASSDWSIFTSSDDASFTTESTRDSFSTIDYTDNDPISSIFNTLYSTTPDYNHTTVRASSRSNLIPMKSYQGCEPPYRLQKVCSSDSNSNCGLYMKYESDHKDSMNRTSGHCTL